ncbi:hypothetical protein Sango_0100700, partial [Sesamum angolense]
MEMRKAVFFLLLVVGIPQLSIPGVEAKVCESKLNGFMGLCVRGHNCVLECRKVGYSSGICKGFNRRRCYCNKP